MSFSEIQRGDLIFFPSDGSWWDFFIRLVSPKYTHIGLITRIENRTIYMIDANFFGIKEHEIKTYHGVTVRRIKSFTEEEKEKMIDFMFSCTDGHYSILGGIWAGVLRKLNITSLSEPKDKFFHCSEIITKSIRKIIPSFFKNIAAENILPDDIDRWEELKTIHEFSF